VTKPKLFDRADSGINTLNPSFSIMTNDVPLVFLQIYVIQNTTGTGENEENMKPSTQMETL
jgi:hypothetical protein